MGGAGAGPKCQIEISPLANNFFPPTHAARTTASNLDSACRTRVQASVTPLAYEMLAHVETFLNAGNAVNPGNGSLLVNGLISCISTLCTTAGRPGINFAPSLSPRGMFAFRLGPNDFNIAPNDAANVVARDWTPFGTDWALWGIEVPEAGKAWSFANKSTWTIVFGSPVADDPLTLLDESVGGLQYDIKRWPKFGPFAEDGLVYVGVCFKDGPLKSAARAPRIQREGTLLASRIPEFCEGIAAPASTQLASIAAPFAAVARAIVPASWGFQFTQTERVPRVGGGALDFSRFAPVDADVAGYLTWTFVEPKNLRVGQTIPNFTVTAYSGAGTPVERVNVEVYTAGNNGFPAGAELQPEGNRFGVTNETQGAYTYSGLSLEKTGGFRICARGSIAGFTFTEVCSELFNVRK